MKYKAEMQVVNDDKWYSNALRFDTRQEAEDYAIDLYYRWLYTIDYRVVECHEKDLAKEKQM